MPKDTITVQTLHKTSWVALRRISHPKYGDYDFLHEVACDGLKVVVLPFRAVSISPCEHCDNGGDPRECHVSHFVVQLLMRDELTPCWNIEHRELSSITGGWESGDDNMCQATAIRELSEEGGYCITKDQLMFLGTAYGTKSTDTLYYIYAVDLTDVTPANEGIGDGSALEAAASCRWIVDEEILSSPDPHAYVAYNRLIALLFKQLLSTDKS